MENDYEMSQLLTRYSLVDGNLVESEDGEWCEFSKSTEIMSAAANLVYAQVSAAYEFTIATEASAKSSVKYLQSVKNYLESVWLK